MSGDQKTRAQTTPTSVSAWLRIQDVFEQAMTVAESQRSEFLETVCADEEEIRSEVECLLKSFDAAEQEFEVAIHKPLTPVEQSEHLSGYQLLSEVHRGGQGVVYRAVQLSTRREVALKFLLAGSLAAEANRRRFEREVELVSNLAHPGIVPIFDSGLNHDQYFFAMEFVDGETLDALKRSWKEPRQVLATFAQLCDAIGHAHSRGVIHRDLKPSNILIDSSGRPRVLDFGIAKSQTADRETMTLSIAGTVMGTPAYMSPEQASGRPDEIDARSDVYALGVMLYETLTRCMPYELRGSLTENLATIQSVPPDRSHLRLCGVATDVATIILKSLSKEKGRRYADANQMGADIQRYLNGEPIEARRDSALYVLGKSAKRYHLPLAILFVLAFGVAIGSWVSQGGGGPRFSPPLEALPPGEFYSASNLEDQAMTLQSMVEEGHSGGRVVGELIIRFGSLERDGFDGLDDEAEADLEAMQELAGFFAQRPSGDEIRNHLAGWQSRFESRAPGGRVKSSGLVNVLVADILKVAAQTPESELYAPPSDQHSTRSVTSQSDGHSTSANEREPGA